MPAGRKPSTQTVTLSAERSSNAFLSEPRGFLPEGNRKWNGTLPEGVAGGEMDNPEALEASMTC